MTGEGCVEAGGGGCGREWGDASGPGALAGRGGGGRERRGGHCVEDSPSPSHVPSTRPKLDRRRRGGDQDLIGFIGSTCTSGFQVYDSRIAVYLGTASLMFGI